MKVFLSWSGELSHKVALVYRDWLPSVIQSVNPYVSSEDIDKGARWSTDIAKELGESSYGVLCVTNTNVDAPWLNFEAGALSKAFDKSNVSPFLFNIKRSEIKSGPLLQFQSTTYTKNDVSKLLKGINKALGDGALSEERLKTVFDVWWPELDAKLKELEKSTPKINEAAEDVSQQEGQPNEILEELLELVRSQQRLLRSPDEILPPEYFMHVFNKYGLGREEHPGVMRDLQNGLKELTSLVSESRETNKRTVSLKELEALLTKFERPIKYLELKQKRKQERKLEWGNLREALFME